MKFITIQKQQLTNVVVNINTKAFYEPDLKEVMETVDLERLKISLRIPPKEINIQTNKYLSEQLLRAITPAYLRGTQITVNGITFDKCENNPQYFYEWTTSIPSKLPQYLKDAYKSYKLRGELYQDLVKWNQERIQKAIEYSKFKYNLAEEFYKNLYKIFTPKIKVLSPNKKTFYEANAEITFFDTVRPQEALNEQENEFLWNAQCKNYIKAFGLQDTTTRIGTRHRTTPHGTTNEPIIISESEIESEMVAHIFRKKDNRKREGYINDDGFEVISWNSTGSSVIELNSKQRENIETLKYFLSLDKETQKELLIPGWHYCPVCGELYHENEGCYSITGECHIEEITFVPYNENHDDFEF